MIETRLTAEFCSESFFSSQDFAYTFFLYTRSTSHRERARVVDLFGKYVFYYFFTPTVSVFLFFSSELIIKHYGDKISKLLANHRSVRREGYRRCQFIFTTALKITDYLIIIMNRNSALEPADFGRSSVYCY